MPMVRARTGLWGLVIDGFFDTKVWALVDRIVVRTCTRHMWALLNGLGRGRLSDAKILGIFFLIRGYLAYIGMDARWASALPDWSECRYCWYRDHHREMQNPELDAALTRNSCCTGGTFRRVRSIREPISHPARGIRNQTVGVHTYVFKSGGRGVVFQ